MIDKVQITLRGEDGKEHATGLVDLAKLLNSHLVEHNRRLYYFKPSSRIGNYIFEECNQPYIITEF